jgi:hypothetical protein
LKLVAWAKKNALQFSLESQPAQANYCRSIYSDHSCSKRTNGFERILAHRIDCQRARPPCPAERLTNNLMSIRRQATPVNTHLMISTRILSASNRYFYRATIPADQSDSPCKGVGARSTRSQPGHNVNDD